MDIDVKQLQALVELLQGGGTAGLLVFGFLMLRAFKELHEKIDRIDGKRTVELIKIRERLIRMEIELESLSKARGGNFRAHRDDNDPEDS